MAKKRVIQGRGKEREPSLAAIESSGTAPDQQPIRIYAPESAEYQSYSELLKVFFEKFARWDAILTQKQYRVHDSNIVFYREYDKNYTSAASLVQTPQGVMLYSSTEKAYLYPRDPRYARQDAVILAKVHHDDLPFVSMSFDMGTAGKQVLVDPDGEPLSDVGVLIGSFHGGKEVIISAGYDADKWGSSLSEGSEKYLPRDIKYRLQEDGSLQVSRSAPYGPGSVLMPIQYATHLLNTIDSLIPGPHGLTPQPEQSLVPELPILPYAGRRLAGQ